MPEAQTYLSKCISQKRSIYSNRTVSYVIALLELLTVLLEYIDLSVFFIFISKNSYCYKIFYLSCKHYAQRFQVPIMLIIMPA